MVLQPMVSFVMLLSTFGFFAGGYGREPKYLTDTGKLTAPLEFRIGQEGFAGVTGEVCTCQPNGTWSVSRFINERIEKPHRTGTLTTQDLKNLAGTLSAERFSKLPTEFGRDIKVNRKLALPDMQLHVK